MTQQEHTQLLNTRAGEIVLCSGIAENKDDPCKVDLFVTRSWNEYWQGHVIFKVNQEWFAEKLHYSFPEVRTVSRHKSQDEETIELVIDGEQGEQMSFWSNPEGLTSLNDLIKVTAEVAARAYSLCKATDLPKEW